MHNSSNIIASNKNDHFAASTTSNKKEHGVTHLWYTTLVAFNLLTVGIAFY
jgi:hypothetical protein